jgi:hypothetical protein
MIKGSTAPDFEIDAMLSLSADRRFGRVLSHQLIGFRGKRPRGRRDRLGRQEAAAPSGSVEVVAGESAVTGCVPKAETRNGSLPLPS